MQQVKKIEIVEVSGHRYEVEVFEYRFDEPVPEGDPSIIRGRTLRTNNANFTYSIYNGVASVREIL